MKLSTAVDNKLAIEYIRERGYASYSSLKRVRDGWDGVVRSYPALDLGTELHSRFLENTILTTFNDVEEDMLKGMENSLRKDKVVQALMKDATCEVEFKEKVYGLPTLGYIDILPKKKLVGDLKTTKATSLKQFIDQMDFMQVALYLKATKREDFYYIGISKSRPYPVFTFRAMAFPDKIQQANNELKKAITDVKRELGL